MLTEFLVLLALVAFLSLVLGELVPKSLALRYATGYAFLIARPLHRLSLVMRPLVWFLTGVLERVPADVRRSDVLH